LQGVLVGGSGTGLYFEYFFSYVCAFDFWLDVEASPFLTVPFVDAFDHVFGFVDVVDEQSGEVFGFVCIGAGGKDCYVGQAGQFYTGQEEPFIGCFIAWRFRFLLFDLQQGCRFGYGGSADCYLRAYCCGEGELNEDY
jgi:hypothetical protein